MGGCISANSDELKAMITNNVKNAIVQEIPKVLAKVGGDGKENMTPVIDNSGLKTPIKKVQQMDVKAATATKAPQQFLNSAPQPKTEMKASAKKGIVTGERLIENAVNALAYSALKAATNIITEGSAIEDSAVKSSAPTKAFQKIQNQEEAEDGVLEQAAEAEGDGNNDDRRVVVGGNEGV